VWEQHTGIGWAGGIGAEVAVVANWTAKVEYLYVDLDSSPYVLSGTSHGIASNVLRIGVNYRF
jgi:outer membrane immunogenic protein